MASQTDRPGVSQTRHPQGVLYVTPELMPQGVIASVSMRGAPILIQFTNPQRPRYGTGVTSITPPPCEALLPGMGPLDRGY